MTADERNHNSSTAIPMEWNFRDATPTAARLDAGLSEADAASYLARFKSRFPGRKPEIAHNAHGARAIRLQHVGPASEVYITTVSGAESWLS